MICMRMRRAALCSLAGLGASIAFFSAPTVGVADIMTPNSELSQANRLSIFHDYSIDAVGLMSTGTAAGSPGSGVLTSLLGSWASTDVLGGNHSYAFTVTPIAGYDSDPEASRSARGGAFVGADLNAAYRWNIGPDDATVGSPTQVRVAYDATGAVYDGEVLNADTFQQTLSASYRRSIFHDSLVLGFMADDQFTTEFGNAFLNSFDAGPSIEWFLLSQVSAEASYEYSRLDFFQRTVASHDPDANRHTINTKVHFYSIPQQRGDIPESPDVLGDILRQSLTRATFGYAAVFNDGRGGDYQYESNRLSIGLEGVRLPRLPDISMDVMYAYEFQNYFGQSREGPVVIAGTPLHMRRKDHLDVFTMRVNAKLFDLPRDRGTLSTFAQWDIIGDRSNIVVRDFNEFIISGGITYRY